MTEEQEEVEEVRIVPCKGTLGQGTQMPEIKQRHVKIVNSASQSSALYWPSDTTSVDCPLLSPQKLVHDPTRLVISQRPSRPAFSLPLPLLTLFLAPTHSRTAGRSSSSLPLPGCCWCWVCPSTLICSARPLLRLLVCCCCCCSWWWWWWWW